MPDFPNGPIRPGNRIAVVGRAGSGKTYLTRYTILRSPNMRWIVIDTKHDPEFDHWAPEDGLVRMDGLAKRWRDRAIVVVRPKPSQMAPFILDAYLGDLHDGFERIGVSIDETYQVAFGPRAGPGLTGLVTRGRARKQSVIMGSQRPAWLPKFVFTEANGYVIMSLNIEDDRKTIYKMTGKERVMERMKPRQWLYYDIAADTMTSYGPVTIK